MTTALLDHVRYSDSMDATLERVRRHLAEAIDGAVEDGEMPTDPGDLERIGRLVEDVTAIILGSNVESEHFVFGAYGTFGGMLSDESYIVAFEMPSGADSIDFVLECKASREVQSFENVTYSEALDRIGRAVGS